MALSAVALFETLFGLVAARAGEVRLEVVRANQILDVEERRAIESHVDESGLHPGKDTFPRTMFPTAPRAAARSIWSSAITPFSMSATRVSRMSQLMTKVLRAMQKNLRRQAQPSRFATLERGLC